MLAAATLDGCATARGTLSTDAREMLRAPRARLGAVEYTGTVVPHGATSPSFCYERRVSEDARGARVSTHVTMAASDPRGDALVVQQATHDGDYRLQRYDEVHGQLGLRATVLVREDGTVHYAVTRGAEPTTSVEPAGAPVVVGPTLFGFVRSRLEALRTGEAIAVRFIVADRARSYPFSLRWIGVRGDTETVEMRADQWFVRLAVASMRITFDTRTREVRTYAGRIPPRDAKAASREARRRPGSSWQRSRDGVLLIIGVPVTGVEPCQRGCRVGSPSMEGDVKTHSDQPPG